MQLVVLLLVLVIAGAWMSRLGGGPSLSPLPPNAPRPTETLQRLDKAVEEAGQADRQRLDDAMKGLR